MSKKVFKDENEAIRELMSAICFQAATDYQCAIRTRKRYGRKAKALEDRKNRGEDLSIAEEEYLRKFERKVAQEPIVVRFFNSQWGESLSGQDGQTVVNALKRNAERLYGSD